MAVFWIKNSRIWLWVDKCFYGSRDKIQCSFFYPLNSTLNGNHLVLIRKSLPYFVYTAKVKSRIWICEQSRLLALALPQGAVDLTGPRVSFTGTQECRRGLHPINTLFVLGCILSLCNKGTMSKILLTGRQWKIDSKWTTDLNVSIKLKKEKGEHIWEPGLDKRFLGLTLKAQPWKGKMVPLDFIKLKSYCPVQGPV